MLQVLFNQASTDHGARGGTCHRLPFDPPSKAVRTSLATATRIKIVEMFSVDRFREKRRP